MSISEIELQKIATLARLNIDGEISDQLIHDVKAIMNLVEKLRAVDTDGIAPLSHPLSGYQFLRKDLVTEGNQIEQLAMNAQIFENDLYMVPKVIESC